MIIESEDKKIKYLWPIEEDTLMFGYNYNGESYKGAVRTFDDWIIKDSAGNCVFSQEIVQEWLTAHVFRRRYLSDQINEAFKEADISDDDDSDDRMASSV